MYDARTLYKKPLGGFMFNASALYNECVVNPNITILRSYFKPLFSLLFKFIPILFPREVVLNWAKGFCLIISLYFSLKFLCRIEGLLNDN